MESILVTPIPPSQSLLLHPPPNIRSQKQCLFKSFTPQKKKMWEMKEEKKNSLSSACALCMCSDISFISLFRFSVRCSNSFASVVCLIFVCYNKTNLRFSCHSRPFSCFLLCEMLSGFALKF